MTHPSKIGKAIHDRDIGLAQLSPQSKQGPAENKNHFQDEHPHFS